MKTLITLSVLQTIGIAALVVHALRESPPAAPASAPASPIAAAPAAVAPNLDEARLRAIIREELVQSDARADATPTAAPRPHDMSAQLHRREVIAQQIEAYRATGTITDSQMQELQADIAKLDEASRKQMLSKLLRALNSGDIKGRL
ncbi:MAG TPA: hypothetical protein VFV69_01990 [Steroidobacteraceae bacterium]|jgi:parvulin-like peptidyl-prolyl isomerase|nr:hypothetical protein [Steroidobacteraceae bacterium]